MFVAHGCPCAGMHAQCLQQDTPPAASAARAVCAAPTLSLKNSRNSRALAHTCTDTHMHTHPHTDTTRHHTAPPNPLNDLPTYLPTYLPTLRRPRAILYLALITHMNRKPSVCSLPTGICSISESPSCEYPVWSGVWCGSTGSRRRAVVVGRKGAGGESADDREPASPNSILLVAPPSTHPLTSKHTHTSMHSLAHSLTP